MNKKRKPLSAVSAPPPETDERTIDAILSEVGGEKGGKTEKPPKKTAESKQESAPAPPKKKKAVPLAHLGQKIDVDLYNEMRVYVAKQKINERGYSIRMFLEGAIADKLAKVASSTK